MKRLTALFMTMLCAFCIAAPAVPAAAYDPFNGVKCNKSTGDSAVCNDKSQGSSNPLTGSDGLLIKITDIIAFVAGVAAVIIVLVGSIRYILSNGDSNAIGSAKSTIMNALIGVIVVVAARSIIVFVLNRI